jgi:hypothetical protein
LFVLAYILCMSNARERAECLMWLPVTIPFLVVVGFTTAISVSYGTGMIVRDFVDDKQKRPPNLSKMLTDDDRGRSNRK